VREDVFVREQQVPLELEWDEMDEKSAHVLAEAGALPIGTGRLLPDGHIGRMAVLASWRGRGVGAALLTELLAMATKRGMHQVILHAQTHARRFYERHGFRAQGAEFMEANIAHVRMLKRLKPPR
jgi:predicted GNAT family N-acyltransferase